MNRFTINDIVRRLGLHRLTIRRAVLLGQLRGEKKKVPGRGGHPAWYFTIDAVREFEQSRGIEPRGVDAIDTGFVLPPFKRAG